MTEPILTRDQILEALTVPGLNVEASLEPREVGLLCAAIADLLAEVCREPIYQTSWKYPASVWGDVSKDVYDNYQLYRYVDRRIVYALTRSKP
ncbi:hypothetical protein [Burkholderia ambifaria]|jgi:hypothetical protein|uniref:hypothetical protein n=1 Tax=Burkholderia ambifaria TaxID=152480 RepID=UPI00158A2AC6|nr:hypothetical protein [Burkholderia ambifaria]